LSIRKLLKIKKIIEICICSQIGCSRYQQKHMLAHHDSVGHNISLSLSDHSFFCYACDSYIDSPKLAQVNQQLIDASE